MNDRKPPSLVFATGNPGKVLELQELLQEESLEVLTAAALGLTLSPDEPYATFLQNARHKALFVSAQTPHLVLGEDSGLEVEALDGQPGVKSRRFSGPSGDTQTNNAKLLRKLRGTTLQQRQASFRCVLVFARKGEVVFEAIGACEGVIAEEPRGNNGFGYDPIFLLPAHGRTMAELSKVEKNCLSHRAHALQKARNFLRQYALDA